MFEFTLSIGGVSPYLLMQQVGDRMSDGGRYVMQFAHRDAPPKEEVNLVEITFRELFQGISGKEPTMRHAWEIANKRGWVYCPLLVGPHYVLAPRDTLSSEKSKGVYVMIRPVLRDLTYSFIFYVRKDSELSIESGSPSPDVVRDWDEGLLFCLPTPSRSRFPVSFDG